MVFSPRLTNTASHPEEQPRSCTGTDRRVALPALGAQPADAFLGQAASTSDALGGALEGNRAPCDVLSPEKIQHQGEGGCQAGMEAGTSEMDRSAPGLATGWWAAASPVFQKRAEHSRTWLLQKQDPPASCLAPDRQRGQASGERWLRPLSATQGCVRRSGDELAWSSAVSISVLPTQLTALGLLATCCHPRQPHQDSPSPPHEASLL